MGVIFAKTPKGQDEITSKAGGLTPRIRRVLIFVDGKRSIDDLRGMLQSDDLQHTLGMLEEEGYIELAGSNPQTAVLPAITAFLPLPESPDPLRLQQARNFMRNTLNAFVGAVGASSLITRIEGTDDHAGLRAHYDEWYHAMVISREDRREAEDLRDRLLKII